MHRLQIDRWYRVQIYRRYRCRYFGNIDAGAEEVDIDAGTEGVDIDADTKGVDIDADTKGVDIDADTKGIDIDAPGQGRCRRDIVDEEFGMGIAGCGYRYRLMLLLRSLRLIAYRLIA
jgi:hypothetical protein